MDTHILDLETLENCSKLLAYVLSNGLGFTLRDFSEVVQKVTDFIVSFTFGPLSARESARFPGDSSKVREKSK